MRRAARRAHSFANCANEWGTRQSTRMSGASGVGAGSRSKSPPCRGKRDKDGATSRVKISERVGQPPANHTPSRVQVREDSKMHRSAVRLLLLAAALLVAGPTRAEPLPFPDPDLPPGPMFAHTVPIKVGREVGTGFFIYYSGRLYLITAKHIVETLPRNGATIQIYLSLEWKDFKVDILSCKSGEVDAVALSFEQPGKLPIVDPGPEPSASDVTVGTSVFFFGFPNFGKEIGLHTLYRHTGQHMPLVKRGILSASDWIDQDANLYYFDAFNNKGFSGGPIIAFSKEKKQWQIIAVVCAYLPEASQVRSQGKFVDSQNLVNSGVMLGYSIRHVLDAIDNSIEHPM